MVKALGAPKAQQFWQEDVDRVMSAYDQWTAIESESDTQDEFEGTVELAQGFVGSSETELGAGVQADAGNVAALAGGEASAKLSASREKNRDHDNKITARIVIKAKSKTLV